MENIKIINKEIEQYEIDEFGNRVINYANAYYLEDEKGNRVSNYYSYIEEYGNNLYLVSVFSYGEKFTSKDGIIEIKKENGIVKEHIVVPIIYDRIFFNNENTATAYANNEHMTYIDLDNNSEYYGAQLVPAVLSHAAPFDKEYKGYAECSINNIVGYLPRNIIPRRSLSASDLLTETEVKYITKSDDLRIYENAINKINELGVQKRTLKK